MGGISRRAVLLPGASAGLRGADTTLAQLIVAVRGKAKSLESSAVTREGFESFIARFKVQVSYSDYVVTRLLFEATRDAGFWNLHWVITNMPPNSDQIWRQWKTVKAPNPVAPTAIAECDELSALFAFLAGRAGVRSVGLLWPYPNHTVAVWTVGAVRVVIPTTQIFLEESDYWGTKKFDPWRQKAIYEYIRRDVPDSFEIPQPLFAFFVRQMDKYAGASDATLQMLRYFRESVFLKGWTPEQAAREALKRRAGRSHADPAENLAALESFAEDMRSSGSNGVP